MTTTTKIDEFICNAKASCQSEARAVAECLEDALDGCDSAEHASMVSSIADEFIGWGEAMRQLAEPDAPPWLYECGNCSKGWTKEQLHELCDVWERVQPGDVMPDGQCPECQCACYEKKEAPPKITNVRKVSQSTDDMTVRKTVDGIGYSVTFDSYGLSVRVDGCSQIVMVDINAERAKAILYEEGADHHVSDWLLE